MIIITGQTATGKTTLAYKLAKKYNGELINCDSRQVYKKLDIITGKQVFPDIKTHLLDIIDPKDRFSSYNYVGLVNNLIKELLNKRVTPILVGGTYLYLKHLLYGIDTQTPADWKLRNKLNKKTVSQLQKTLKTTNPQVFEQLNQSDRNNPHRLIRKIEIGLNKKRKSEDINFFEKNSVSSFIGLRYNNTENLKKTIEKRVEQRIRNGAFQEVKHLIKSGYKLSDPGLNTIGYKQLFYYFNGRVSKEKAVEQWINKELQYAKRQYTFMKKDKNINWTTV